MRALEEKAPAVKKYSAECVSLPFTLSVTGHRNVCLNAGWADVQKLVSALLAGIRNCCLAHHSNTNLRLISGLAAGADQIAASAVEFNNQSEDESDDWALHVVLPFDRQSYSETLYSDIAVGSFASGYIDRFDELCASAIHVFELADRSASCDAYSPIQSAYWRSERFRTVGEILVRQADLLLAIWDGQPGSGVGGTADVVRIALVQGKPVLWVHPDTLEVAFLNPVNGFFDPIALANKATLSASKNTESIFREGSPLDQLAAKILGFPGAGSEGTPLLESAAGYFGVKSWNEADDVTYSESGFDLLQRKLSPWYAWIFNFRFAHRWLSGNSLPERTGVYSNWFVYKWFETTVLSLSKSKHDVAHLTTHTNQPENSNTEVADSQFACTKASSRFSQRVNYAEDDWTQAINSESLNVASNLHNSTRPPHLSDCDSAIRNALISSDAIATQRGHIYRSSYVINFLGGAMAVAIGLLGLFGGEYKYIFVLGELLILVFLIGFYKTAILRSWHRRWLNARHITESLRAGRFLVWMGLGGRRSLNADAPWSAWYSNAVIASCQLPKATLTVESLNYMAAELRSHIRNQIDYHDSNAQRLIKFHHGLDALGRNCLFTAITVASFFVVFFGPVKFDWLSSIQNEYGDVVKYTVTGICAGGPVLAAALMGIRYQGDFERFAERSRETQKELTLIDRRLKILLEKSPRANESPLYEELAGVVLDLVSVYEADLEDWRYVYSARPNPDVG